ncbi:transcriptional regulatory protein ZraR [bacterium BMS3Abin07]|nr:transcriptional regulatory protein ZraR [bacterium BMS3Abin07]GBE31558.1 transcriptional regulatory protein ZraR [bacterium BMS3Bbin05]HDO21445.1 sigma-54-dependent Fis family transcriptional regulator [Nitrospirota bacterium]HDZ87552.1 sigma-54-dependent Fis family transcriptional regulator [Nitrospirota bacterium]
MKSEKYKILVVDDERDICRALEFLLSRQGYSIDTAYDGNMALDKLRKSDYDLMITDLKMEGISGIELMEKALEFDSGLTVVIMTAYASVESAVEAMRKGASDYIVKPFVNEDVLLTIKRLIEHRRVVFENQALKRQLSQHMGCKEFIGESSSMQEIFELLEKVIPTKSNILILGESGTGKGMIAEIVHCNSPRKDHPFMSINCAAIPETLLESELFGYRKGAFTGANSDKAGLISMADGGTLFLDEIGDMSASVQSKILRVLESGELIPLGDTRVRSVDVRIIAATNRNIEQLIRKGLFREDLYYRLSVFEITLPALRERVEDIRVLSHHFVEQFCSEHNKSLSGFTNEAMDLLMGYSWPGNVRELKNVLERAVILCSGEQIDVNDLPDKLKKARTHASRSLKDMLCGFERKIIADALASNKGSKEKAASELGVDLATLYRKMKKLEIDI